MKGEYDETTTDDDMTVVRYPKPKRPKPKVAADWTTADVRDLIQAVEKQPSIWDFSCKEHKTPKTRVASWCQIGVDLDNRFSENELKAKWCNVKNTFTSNNLKLQQNRSVPPTWKHWPEMNKFLASSSESQTNNVSVSKKIKLDKVIVRPPIRKRNPPATSTDDDDAMFDESPIPNPTRKRYRQAKSTLMESMPRTDDEWQIMGNYLATSVRNIAAKNRKAADRLNRTLMKTLMDFLDSLDDE